MTDKAQNVDNLSQRERQVLVLVASGKSTKQIAEKLGIACKTAVVHGEFHSWREI